MLTYVVDDTFGFDSIVHVAKAHTSVVKNLQVSLPGANYFLSQAVHRKKQLRDTLGPVNSEFFEN